MTTPQQNLITRFLNVFTLMHFNYLTDAEKELNEILETPDDHKDSHHAKPVAKLVAHWVADTAKEQNRV